MIATMTDYEAFLEETGLTQAQMDAAVVEVVPLPILYSKRVRLGASSIAGFGMFADRPFAEGEIIGPMKLSGKWTTLGRYLNHEQSPNCEVRENNFHALKPLFRGEELTANYRQIREILTN